ncbi:MAG: PqqD family peptide modification chaperone [Caldilineaceae bacterium]|nr:PqqD family peptide modification chaperone [Caldilineaceae bacterium]
MANPRRIETTRSKPIAGGLAVFDLRSRTFRLLNRTAAFVWNHCDGITEPEAIIGLLQDEFGLSKENAERIFWLAVNDLESSGLLAEPVRTATRPGIDRRQLLQMAVAAGLSAALFPLVSLWEPAAVYAEEVTTTPSETPTTTSAETPTTTSAEIPTTTSAEIPTTTSAEIPTTTSAEIPTTTSAEIPTTTSAEIPTTTSAEIPTTTSAEIPTTTSAEIPTTTGASTTTTTGAPTAVTILSFVATGQGNQILLLWETAGEDGLAGFNLYRGDSLLGYTLGMAVKLNSSPISGKTLSPFLGASYVYTDASESAGSRFYWLEALHTGGGKSVEGPVTPAWWVYIPNLRKG